MLEKREREKELPDIDILSKKEFNSSGNNRNKGQTGWHQTGWFKMVAFALLKSAMLPCTSPPILLVTYYLLFIFKFTLYNMKIILLFKFKLCDKNQWWIWHKIATKYTYNDGARHSAKETRPFIQEEHSGCHQKLTMAKGEQSSKPVFLQLRTPHQPLNRFEAEREKRKGTRWKSTHSSLWPPFSYTKSMLLVRLSYAIFSSATGPRGSRALLKDKLTPETSCNQAWWSAQPQRSEPWQNAIWEVCSEN